MKKDKNNKTFSERFIIWAFDEKDESLAITGKQANNVKQFFISELKSIIDEIKKARQEDIELLNLLKKKDEFIDECIFGYDEAIKIIKKRI